MSYTKREIIQQAFDEIGVTESVGVDVYVQALRKLDAMVAGWAKRGVHLSYPFASSPSEASLDTATTCPDYAHEAMSLGLAIRIAPSFGKLPAAMMDTRKEFKLAFNMLMAHSIEVVERQFPNTLPRGAGHKPHRNLDATFFQEVDTQLNTGKDGPLEL